MFECEAEVQVNRRVIVLIRACLFHSAISSPAAQWSDWPTLRHACDHQKASVCTLIPVCRLRPHTAQSYKTLKCEKHLKKGAFLVLQQPLYKKRACFHAERKQIQLKTQLSFPFHSLLNKMFTLYGPHSSAGSWMWLNIYTDYRVRRPFPGGPEWCCVSRPLKNTHTGEHVVMLLSKTYFNPSRAEGYTLMSLPGSGHDLHIRLAWAAWPKPHIVTKIKIIYAVIYHDIYRF